MHAAFQKVECTAVAVNSFDWQNDFPEDLKFEAMLTRPICIVNLHIVFDFFQARLLADRGAKNFGTLLIEACSGGDVQALQSLVEAGVDLSIARLDGHSVLALAARSGSVETVEYLLQQGAKDSRLTVGTRKQKKSRNP